MFRPFFDTLARHLGYVPMQTPPEQSKPLPENDTHVGAGRHLAMEKDFSYHKANAGLFCYSYFDDVNGYAVGKHDWIPVSALIGMRFGPDWLIENLSQVTWLDRRSPELKDWWAANFSTLSSFDALLQDKDDYFRSPDDDYASVNDEDVELLVMPHVGFTRMAIEFLHLMEVASPIKAWKGFSLSVPVEVVRYHKTGVHSDLKHSSKEAQQSATKMALAWFAQRDFEVDEQNQLVRVPGYQPLFYVAEQEY